MKPDLTHEVANYAHPIVKGWKDSGNQDAPSFQARYIYTQALGASHMAESFWTLFRLGKHDSAKIIARHLLERVYGARLAAKSPEDAVDLIAYEITDKRKRRKQFLKANPGLEQATIDGINQSIDSHEVDLKRFEALMGREYNMGLDYHRRAELVDLEWAHRGLYMDFSNYAHASYANPVQGEIDIPERNAPAIALFAPMDTAAMLHKLSCQGGTCDMGNRYKKLFDEIMEATVRTTDDQWEAMLRF